MLECIVNIFNTREIATIVWGVILWLFVSIKAPVIYKKIWILLMAGVKLWKYWILMVSYIAVSILILFKLNIWTTDFLKPTIFWFLSWALVMFVNLTKMTSEQGYSRKVLLEIFSFTTIILFVSGLYSLSLWVEIFIVPLSTFCSCVLIVVKDNPDYQALKKLSGAVMIVLSLFLIGHSIYKIILSAQDFVLIHVFFEFIIPILLSIMFIPFVYGLSFYVRWESNKKMREHLARNRLDLNEQ